MMSVILSFTFRGLEEADAGLDLGPVQVLLFRGVFYHQLIELHRDDVMVVWKIYKLKLSDNRFCIIIANKVM